MDGGFEFFKAKQKKGIVGFFEKKLICMIFQLFSNIYVFAVFFLPNGYIY